MSPPNPNQKFNQPTNIPFFTKDKSNQITTPDFLKKNRHKTYFGPGQAPDGMTGTAAGYREPMLWNKPSSLLQVPQMVWLSEAFIEGHTQTYEQVLGFGDSDFMIQCNNTDLSTISVSVPGEDDPVEIEIADAINTLIWVDGHIEIFHNKSWFQLGLGIGGSGIYGYSISPAEAPYVTGYGGPVSDGIYFLDAPPNTSPSLKLGKASALPTFTHTIDNYNYIEYQRIDPIFKIVKEKIEKIRPNRTWVDIVDYDGGLNWPAQGIANWPNDRFQNGNIAMRTGDTPQTAAYGHIVVPDPEEGFFGTNFLHIYVGGLGEDTFDNPDNVGAYQPRLQTLTDPTYLASKARLIACYPKFAGYNVYLYGVGTTGQQEIMAEFDPYPLPSPACTPAVFRGPYNQLVSTNTSRNDLVDALNANLMLIGPSFSTYFNNVAADLKKYGYKYGGDSNVITVDYLVQLIAKNFNFNPTTGEDL